MTDTSRTDEEIFAGFNALYSDIGPEESFQVKKPLLAHYTSIHVLESMLKTETVWFSNPLYMNDLEEVRFGILQGVQLVMTNTELEKACALPQRLSSFRQAFDQYQMEFGTRHALDTYVFCLSEHGPEDEDGALSMWRGYGANGDGACIVFDTAKVGVRLESPLILADVEYGSAEERLAWLNELVVRFCKILVASSIPDDKLFIAAYALFQRIKLFALFSKHRGFSEEHEWRVVYMPDRDPNGKLHDMFDYWIGPKGVEPKLKFKVSPIAGVTSDDLTIKRLIDRIIIGPSISSELSVAAIHRMMDKLGHGDLKEKVRASRIPFRSR